MTRQDLFRHVIRHKRLAVAIALSGAALFLPACSPGAGPTNNEMVIDNAMDAYATATTDADDQAEHLEELAAQLNAEAERADPSRAAALRNEAARDLATAAAIRQRGQDQGVRDEDSIEGNAGLLNGN